MEKQMGEKNRKENGNDATHIINNYIYTYNSRKKNTKQKCGTMREGGSSYKMKMKQTRDGCLAKKHDY